MKIIVIQRFPDNLNGIKEAVALINPKRVEEILFFVDPGMVLRSVKGNFPVIVISSQILDTSTTGTYLARQVKALNPLAQFYLYSITPERDESVDGIIPKPSGAAISKEHPLLAAILTSDLKGVTPEALKERFNLV